MLIRFEKINKSYGHKKVLDNLDLDIAQRDIFGILGPSGSGKSTLLKVLLGQVTPDSGKVYYNDEDITGQPTKLKKIIGLTTQENAFYDKLTVLENMQYYANLYSIKEDMFHLLQSVNLEGSKDVLAGAISGGMKRRLDFAISLIHGPKILILDEPTTGLDPLLVEQFWNIVKHFRDEGKTIIVISHIFEEIKKNCTHFGILYGGKIHKTQIRNSTNLLKIFKEVVR